MKKIRFILILLIFNGIVFAQLVSFIAIGDWGREGKYGQKETADQMGIYSASHKTDFVMTLGDNIYENGVAGTDDPKWKTCFENIYTASSLQIPWYVTIGNHDYGLSVQAQIDYSNISSRWKCPARYYSFEKIIDDKTTVLFVITDTSPFIESYKKMSKENDELFEQSVIDINKQDTKLQLEWMDSVLSSSNAKWKIVAGHHPVYTAGQHGNTLELIEQFKPILEKNKVNMYLCGHDHDLQHLLIPGTGVNYFVSGAGSKLRDVGKIEYTLYSKSINGFLYTAISAADINCKFISVTGDELYTYIIK